MRRSVSVLGVTAILMVGAPAPPAAACYGEPCDTISRACYTVEPILHKVKLDPTCRLG